MTQQELLEILDSWENLNVVIKETGNHPTHFDLLMEIALNSQEKNSWRAAWMADKIHDNYPNLKWNTMLLRVFYPEGKSWPASCTSKSDRMEMKLWGHF